MKKDLVIHHSACKYVHKYTILNSITYINVYHLLKIKPSKTNLAHSSCAAGGEPIIAVHIKMAANEITLRVKMASRH